VGIMDFASSAIALFEPIYLWTLHYSLTQILMFYAAVYLLYIILVPLGGRIAAKYGFEHSILYSQFAFIAYYMSLFLLPSAPWLVFLAPLIFAVQKALYWPPYHADFAIFSWREQRGREVSGILSINSAVTVLGPIFGGIVLNFLGFHALFITVSLLFLVSCRPLFQFKEIHDFKPYSYITYWKLLWKPTHKQSTVAYFGYGEELVALVLWPIFLYLAIPNYSELGLLVGFSTLVTVLLVLVIGKKADQASPKSILSLGSFFLAIIWLVRTISMLSPWKLIALDAIGRTAKNTASIPLMSMTYEHGVREDPLAIAVFFEQSLAIGKFLMAIVLIILIKFINPWVAFFAASALVSLLYQLLKAPGPLENPKA